jgi:hypothetical protein
MQVIDSGIATIFVCFAGISLSLSLSFTQNDYFWNVLTLTFVNFYAEDRQILRWNQPRLYEKLSTTYNLY